MDDPNNQSRIIELRQKVQTCLTEQGYNLLDDGHFSLSVKDRESFRHVHTFSKIERLVPRKDFITNYSRRILKNLIDGKDLEVSKITPRLIEVTSKSEYEDMFKWWNLMWWSLPYEHSYGRQMRYIVWDDYHNSPIGLIGLHSPILSWSVRDSYLHIPREERDYWVNQSLNAQRLGALPPYNQVLGGKLVASLMTSETIRKRFEEKYQDKETILKKRVLPSRLLFITTTGAYGKSSIYNRLKYFDQYVAKFIGYSKGSGTFHVPNWLYDDLVIFLDELGYNVGKGYGHGPSRKLHLISQAMGKVGFPDGTVHGIPRAVYIFELAKNIQEVVSKGNEPAWYEREEGTITNFWKQRWGMPRSRKNSSYKNFSGKEFIEQALEELSKNYKYDHRHIKPR